MADTTPIVVIDRQTGQPFEETVLGEKWIRWAYQDASSRFLERILFRSSWISRLMGMWYDSAFSKGKIESVIEELSIDVDEFAQAKESYSSFNEFFIRRLKPPPIMKSWLTTLNWMQLSSLLRSICIISLPKKASWQANIRLLRNRWSPPPAKGWS